tara:strand:+ start:16 stop:381 length:366 start_codon:yes stop_codon:yes gene_type:complete
LDFELNIYRKPNRLQLNDGVGWYLDNHNIQASISFTIKITASHHKKIRYSHYQQELWELIKEKHNFGVGYRRISNLLNENGYKTTRGHKFKSSHVYSILKKKRVADKEYIICLIYNYKLKN